MGLAKTVRLSKWWSPLIPTILSPTLSLRSRTSEIEVFIAQQLLMNKVHGGTCADEALFTCEIKIRDIQILFVDPFVAEVRIYIQLVWACKNLQEGTRVGVEEH